MRSPRATKMGSRLYLAQASSKQRRCGGMGVCCWYHWYFRAPDGSETRCPAVSPQSFFFLDLPPRLLRGLSGNQWQTPSQTLPWIRHRPLMAPQRPSRPTPLARRRHLQTRHRHHPRVRRRRMRQRQSQMRQRRTRTPRRSRVRGQRSQIRQQRSRTRQRRSRRQMRQLGQSQMRQRRIRTPRRSRVLQRRSLVLQRRTLMRRRPQRRRLRQWEGRLRRSRRL